MSANERPSVLNDIESLSLEMEKARPIALTLVALEAYAESVNMPAPDIERHADMIREMEPTRLKRMRKALNAAAELSQLLELTTPEEVHEEPDVPVAPVDEAVEPHPQEPTLASEEVIVQPDESVAESTEASEADASHETPGSDLSESGRAWVRRLLPDYDFTDKKTRQDKTARQVANDLYKQMGEPKTRAYGGKKIDPLARIRQRLRGMTNGEIAEQDRVSREAVSQWFKTFVDKRFSSQPEEIETSRPPHADIEQQGEADAAPSPISEKTESQEPDAKSPSESVVPAAVRPVPTPMTVRFSRPLPTAGESKIKLVNLAQFWANEMKLDSDDAELLSQVLDPSYEYDLSGNHRNKLHHFRKYIEAHLPRLEDSDLDLDSNEIARLSQLLGRVETKGEHSFTAKPQSAREVSMVDGYLVPTLGSELLSGLQKLQAYMQKHDQHQLEENETIVSQFEQALHHAGFSAEQIIGLEAMIGLRDADGIDPSDANEAVRVLQGLFVDNIKKLDEDDDRDLMASLRMLVNTAMGRKTVRDVYHRLHGKDSSVTYDSVTRLLGSGIIKLAM